MNKAKNNNKFKKLKETKLSDVVKSIDGVPVDLFTMIVKQVKELNDIFYKIRGVK